MWALVAARQSMRTLATLLLARGIYQSLPVATRTRGAVQPTTTEQAELAMRPRVDWLVAAQHDFDALPFVVQHCVQRAIETEPLALTDKLH